MNNAEELTLYIKICSMPVHSSLECAVLIQYRKIFACDVWRKRLSSECPYSDSTPFASSLHLILIEFFFFLGFLAKLTIIYPSCSSYRS